MTVDDRGEGGGLPYLVRPDDVISGQPLITVLSPFCANLININFNFKIRSQLSFEMLLIFHDFEPRMLCVCLLLIK